MDIVTGIRLVNGLLLFSSAVLVLSVWKYMSSKYGNVHPELSHWSISIVPPGLFIGAFAKFGEYWLAEWVYNMLLVPSYSSILIMAVWVYLFHKRNF